MPYLDVTAVLFDPDFADKFNVIKRVETVGANGRSVTANQTILNVIGVITAGNQNDLNRREDFQAMTRSISVVTKFRLQGEVQGRQPDLILWLGDYFIVKHTENYSRFGAGFIQAECESIDRVDLEVL